MKRFKKVYIEITNKCNLKCDFCIGNTRVGKFISIKEFEYILSKIKNYTDYIYLHILGESLLHPDINKLVDIANSRGFNVNITTNGYLINRLSSSVRQINISLHSFCGNISLDKYLDNIFNYIDNLDNIYVSLRVWVKNKYYESIIDYISNKYSVNIPSNFTNIKLKDNVFLNSFHEFIWPSLDNNYYSKRGKCYGMIDHIGILSDGTIVPCCLDSMGIINLGNIYNDELINILESDRVHNMINGFKNCVKNEELCCHCSFLDNEKKT